MAGRPHPRVRFWWRLGLAISTVVLAAGTPAPARVKPEPPAAGAFGVELQKDYAARKTRALIERIESDTMMERVFSSRLKDDPGYAVLKSRWEKELLPSFARQLEAFDQFSTLVPSRVVLADDARGLECLLITPQGVVQIVALRLIEMPHGEIRIADLQFGGARLEFARQIRHTLLLLRVPLPVGRDEEEIDLEDLGKTFGETCQQAFAALGRQNPELAFKYWSGVSPAMKRTRIWNELRNRMALLGSVAAMQELERDAQAGGEIDPFLRFALATRAKDRARALEAIDEVLVAHQQLAFFRCAKADMLLEAGRVAEALTLSRDIVDLTPLNITAYVTSVRAAVDTGQPGLAIDLLRRWAAFAAPADIDRGLENFPALAKFRRSPDYAIWRGAAPAAATTSPAPPH